VSGGRRVLLVLHAGRAGAVHAAREVVDGLLGCGITPVAARDDLLLLGVPGVQKAAEEHPAEGCELVVVLGGDGTILRGAALARPGDTPLLGVNLGHVGFLAEAEREDIQATVERIAARSYEVEERLSLDVVVLRDGTAVAHDWALNEVTVEKAARERMLDVLVEVDDRPLSRWGADGVICATPTGSTAYAFSAGGPIVWPEVAALLLVPISAHALFARPIVVAPTSVLAVDVQPTSFEAVMCCDGRRSRALDPGTRVEVRRGARPVRLARLHRPPFTDRLVAKFALPVAGWRRPPDADLPTTPG
jgi:NAD+ kinase